MIVFILLTRLSHFKSNCDMPESGHPHQSVNLAASVITNDLGLINFLMILICYKSKSTYFIEIFKEFQN